jgi:lipopolysaccharide transport system ATP-binding protein
MDSMITADRLGKRYRLGENTAGYGRLTDSLARALRRRPGRDVAEEQRLRELWALRDVSFEVEQGHVVGLIGRNGAGKSTLLKILARVTVPTEGRAAINGRVGSLLEVGTGFHQELTGRENVFLSGAILGMRRAEIQRKFDEIVAFAEVERFIDTPVKRYSSGMGLRLGFAVAAFLEPEVLLVDEVLAVGDRRFREKCMGRIGEVSREDGRTVVFVSHDLNAILSTCSRALLVEGGRLVADGPAEEVVREYEREQAESSAVGGEFLRTTPNPHGGDPLLLSASVLSAAGDGHASYGESLTFVVRTNPDFPSREFGVDVRILDARQRPVAYMSSLEMAGRYFTAGDVVRVEIERLDLAPGSYHVDVNASIPFVQGMDTWPGEIAFDVVRFDPFESGSTFSPDDRTGSIVPAHEWSTE